MTTLPQDQAGGAFAHGVPVTASPVHGAKIPVHGGVVKPQHGIEYVVQNSPFADPNYALAMKFTTPEYWLAGTQQANLAAMSGYSFTRSGEQGAIDASGAVAYFAPNTPAINNRGYHAYPALTNVMLR